MDGCSRSTTTRCTRRPTSSGSSNAGIWRTSNGRPHRATLTGRRASTRCWTESRCEASDLGLWAHEVWGTKLARYAKASAVLQICRYSDMEGGPFAGSGEVDGIEYLFGFIEPGRTDAAVRPRPWRKVSITPSQPLPVGVGCWDHLAAACTPRPPSRPPMLQLVQP